MAWAGRDLPSDWAHRKRTRHQLDGWTCVDCGHHDPTGRTLEADHIGHRDDHRIEALRTRCARCHARRTKAQAAAGRAAMPRARRAAEPHPGLN